MCWRRDEEDLVARGQPGHDVMPALPEILPVIHREREKIHFLGLLPLERSPATRFSARRGYIIPAKFLCLRGATFKVVSADTTDWLRSSTSSSRAQTS